MRWPNISTAPLCCTFITYPLRVRSGPSQQFSIGKGSVFSQRGHFRPRSPFSCRSFIRSTYHFCLLLRLLDKIVKKALRRKKADLLSLVDGLQKRDFLSFLLLKGTDRRKTGDLDREASEKRHNSLFFVCES